MTQAMQHVTIATSTGAVRVALLAHFGAGLIGLGTGFLALAVTKGARVHRRSGMVFVVAMISAMLLATGIALYESKWSMVMSAPFGAYLVYTAMTTVRPLDWEPRWVAPVLAAYVLAIGATQVVVGVQVAGLPGASKGGVPAEMFIFPGVVALLAGVGDVRMIRAGGIQGTRRIARHLWRMCFALFVASGSFFLEQMKFLPAPVRIPMLLMVPALAPLVVMGWWMWRVMVRRSLRGIACGNAERAVGQSPREPRASVS